MGCAFLISATLNLSGWKKGVSKTANLLKHSEGEERHLSNIPMERGKSNSRSSTPHLLHLKQCTSFRHGWEAQKEVTLKRNPFFPPSHDDAREANTSPNAWEKLCGKSASGKAGKKWAQEIKPFEARGFSSSLLIFPSL